MDEGHPNTNEFLDQVRQVILDHLSDERFGVSELASRIGMSRSNLLRKINQRTRMSASAFIREVRLEQGMGMLREGTFNVSEVSYKVGFGSTSYFIKCFREKYGFPPGEVAKRGIPEDETGKGVVQTVKKRWNLTLPAAVLTLVAVILFVVIRPFASGSANKEKSIAVLPFKNDSRDTSNLYIINGLMESILDNLQKIGDLRVISRTSVEKYREQPKTIPEIARELNANYLVEGSGQKIGDQIMLHIQLIDASQDKHIWSRRYSRETKDIFRLQIEVAQSIAGEIEAVITPEEAEMMNKLPTDNLEAYDLFMKGMDHFYKGNRPSLDSAIGYYQQAIALDPGFARAYADMAISYYLKDMYQAEYQYTEEINNYGDKAMLYDPELAQSLIAKALYYIHVAKYEQAVPYLENALKHHPNSALIINILSDFYTNYIPDTEKYLEYALKGIGLDIASNDSANASYIYLHVSNALLQTGFLAEAEEYVRKSLDYNPDNLYSETLKAYIGYTMDGDLEHTREALTKAFKKDTNRYDIIQEIGKVSYFMRDFETAYQYYRKLIEIREKQNLDVYQFEDAKIAYVLDKMGYTKEADRYMEQYKKVVEQDESLYKPLSMGVYYAYRGDTARALEQLELFSRNPRILYLMVPFMKIDPLLDNLKGLDAFDRILQVIDVSFWKYHNKVEATLREKGLLKGSSATP